MGIRTMPWDEWIEVRLLAVGIPCVGPNIAFMLKLDDRFTSYHKIRDHRIQTRGNKVVRIVPERPGLVRGGSHAGL